MRPQEAPGNGDVDALLDEAESLLNKDIDKDIEELQKSSYNFKINYDKYEKAKVLFEKVLDIDPRNKRANDGLNACLQMLQPYYPVQYMAPIDPNMKIELPVLVEGGEKKESPVVREEKKPWEILADYRARDKEGIRYTGEAFGKARKKAEADVLELVERARRQFKSGEKEPATIYNEIMKEIETMQEGLHRGWKGHGPEVLEFASEKLKEVLGL